MTKRSLAILGGEPAFETPLHVGRPNLGDEASLLRRVSSILERRWLTNDGPLVRELEDRLAALLSVRHCVAVSNATTGLQLVAQALGLDGEVIVPAFTFVGTAHALAWQRLVPVFADVEADSHVLSPEAVRAAVSPHTTGIVGVHVWGHPCNVGALREVAKEAGVPLLFDAAHALGCSFKGKMLGRFGEAEVFSLHATKVVNSFEGGVISTDDDGLADELRLLRNFGFSGQDRVVRLGINAKMSEAAAAMGLTGLDAFRDIVEVNRRNLNEYAELLDPLPGVRVRRPPSDSESNHHYVVVEVDGAEAGLSRDELVTALEAERILARRYFYPGCHRMKPYADGLVASRTGPLAATELLCQRVLQLPTGTALRLEDVRRVAEVVARALDEKEAVSRAAGPILKDGESPGARSH